MANKDTIDSIAEDLASAWGQQSPANAPVSNQLVASPPTQASLAYSPSTPSIGSSGDCKQWWAEVDSGSGCTVVPTHLVSPDLMQLVMADSRLTDKQLIAVVAFATACSRKGSETVSPDQSIANAKASIENWNKSNGSSWSRGYVT